MKLVITGCGRSGTKFLANLLNAAGVPTAHEGNVTQYGRGAEEPYDVDVSWLRVENLGELVCPVWHVTRHPLLVAASYKRMCFFGNKQGRHIECIKNTLGWNGEVRKFPELDYWIDWNKRIEEYAELRFDICSVGEDWLDYAATRLGGESNSNSAKALSDKMTNTYGNRNDGIKFDLQAYSRADELVELAGKYGYEIGE